MGSPSRIFIAAISVCPPASNFASGDFFSSAAASASDFGAVIIERIGDHAAFSFAAMRLGRVFDRA